MSATQKGMVAAITLTVLLLLVGFGIWASQESMGVLFTNLPPTDANRIVEDLKKSNIKYDLSRDQRTISVPESRVGELRLQFAGEGLPQGEGIGFEKLEDAQPHHHRLHPEGDVPAGHGDRAGQDHHVHPAGGQATVHISPTNDSPFVTEKEDAKASVLLKLKGSRILPEENTQAIVNLVAASVEGLKPEHVVVMDQFSRILSRTGTDPMTGASDSQRKVQREEEDHLVQRVTELLEPVVGLGKVRATAHVDLDFDKVKTNQESYDPQGQVERETKVIKDHEEKDGGRRRRARHRQQRGPGRRPRRLRRPRRQGPRGERHPLRNHQDPALGGAGAGDGEAHVHRGDRGPRQPVGQGRQGRTGGEAGGPHPR